MSNGEQTVSFSLDIVKLILLYLYYQGFPITIIFTELSQKSLTINFPTVRGSVVDTGKSEIML